MDSASVLHGAHEMQKLHQITENTQHPQDHEILAVSLNRRTSSNINSDSQHEAPPAIEFSRKPARVAAILAALAICLFIAALDITIIATAVPTIARDLGSAAGYTWVGGSYILASAAATPIWAKLSDVWGRKLMLLLALAVFFAGSTACATAQTMEVLIASRALQGTAGGGLILLVSICISDLFSVRLRSLFIGISEVVWGLAGAVGPVLGGVFASLVTWRWCFYINLPTCGVAFVLIALFLDIPHEKTSFADGVRALDWFGIFSFLACILMLLLGLDFGGSLFAWDSAKVIALIVVGALMIVAFIYSEARVAKYPVMPLGLWKQKSNVASLLVTFFHGCIMIAASFYLPLYFQSVLGVTPFASGVILLPLIVMVSVVAIPTGIIIHRTGKFRELMWTGSLILTIGSGLFIYFDAKTSRAVIIGFQLITGIGIGLLLEPPLIAIHAQVKQEDVATATSTFTFIRCVAQIIALVIGAAVFQNSMDSRANFLRQAGLSELVVDQLSGRNAAANIALTTSLPDVSQRLAVKEAFAWSIRNMWIMYTVFAFCALIASSFVDAAHLTTEHTETVTGIKKKTQPVPDQVTTATPQEM